MEEPLVAHLSLAFDLASGQRARLLRQPTIGPVIPDMLLGIWSGDLPRWRSLNPISRHILAWLSVQKTANDEEHICDSLFISRNAASTAVSLLERVGAIAKKDSGEIALQQEFDASNSVRIIAIEMKLRRWREALEQAIAYQKFADEAYVVLGETQRQLSCEARDAFSSCGVGLIIYDDGRFEAQISAASKMPIPSADRVLALTKLSSGPYCSA